MSWRDYHEPASKLARPNVWRGNVLANEWCIALLGNGRSAEGLAKHRRLVDEPDHRFDSSDAAVITNGDTACSRAFSIAASILGGEVLAEVASEVSVMTE